MTIRTKSEGYYLPPYLYLNSEAKKRKLDIDKYIDIVQDFCNLYADGELRGQFEMEEILYDILPEKTKEDELQFILQQQLLMQIFITTAFEANIFGNSPMQRAFNLIELMGDSLKMVAIKIETTDGEPKISYEDDYEDEEDESIGVGKEGYNPETGGKDVMYLPEFTKNDESFNEAMEKLQEIINTVKSIDDIDKQLFDSNEVDTAKQICSNEYANNMFRMAMFLKGKGYGKYVIETEPDINGNIVVERPIEGIDEINQLSGSDWWKYKKNKKMFFYDVVSQNVSISETHSMVQRQYIYILMDISGSMSGRPIQHSSGIVYNRMRAVIEGTAVVYLSFFDDKWYEPFKVDNAKTALQVIEKLKENPCGGGTDIRNAIIHSYQFIQNNIKSKIKPEMVIITDEDSSVLIDKNVINSAKVHGFAINCENKLLENLCKQTKGDYFPNFTLKD